MYKSINALWKEVFLMKSMKLEETIKIINVLSSVVELMSILNPHKFEEEIFMEAGLRGITAHDASYVVLARKYGLILVTEDSDLRKKVKEIIRVSNLSEIIKR